MSEMRRIMSWPLRTMKHYLAKVMCIIEYCDDCGIHMDLVWWADDSIWNELAPEGGCLCTRCFDRRASKKGILLRWMPTVDCRRAR